VIKALIFDNNGVLTKTEGDGINKMAELFGVSHDEYNEVWKEYAKPLDDGGLTSEEFLMKVINYFGKEVEIDSLREIYYDCYDRDDEMHETVKNLRDKFEVALLSNFGDSFDKFEEKWRTHETIKPENMFVSVKLGMRKPHRDIYEHALSKLGLEPHEAVFIDDRLENIEAAKDLGMHGIHFSNRDQFLVELQGLTAND